MWYSRNFMLTHLTAYWKYQNSKYRVRSVWRRKISLTDFIILSFIDLCKSRQSKPVHNKPLITLRLTVFHRVKRR